MRGARAPLAPTALPGGTVRWRAIPWGVLGLLGLTVAFAPLVWRLRLHAGRVLAYPWQIDFDEGVVLHAAWLVAQGQNPYPPLSPDAFISATYPPLYYLLSGAWLRVAGLGLEGGRAISLLAAAWIALVLLWWVRRECRSWPAGLLAAAIWLSLSPVYVWGLFFKPDLLALALTTSGIAAARRWPTWPGLAVAVGLLAAAAFTKQSALAGPLAVGLWLLWRGGPWRGFGLATGGLVLGLFAALNVWLQGGPWVHIVLLQQLPWSLDHLGHNLDKLTDTYPWLLAGGLLAGAWLLGATWRGAAPGAAAGATRRARSASLPLLALLAATLVVLVANGRTGVNHGLLLDLFPPLCAVVGVAAGDLLHRRPDWRLAPGLVLAGLLATQALADNEPGAWYSSNRMPSAERAAQMENLARLVARTPGPILSEDLWLVLRAGRAVRYDDTFLMAQTARRGLWDERRLVANLEGQRYDLILLEYDITGAPASPRWSPTALRALRQNYRVTFRDVVFVHEPRATLGR